MSNKLISINGFIQSTYLSFMLLRLFVRHVFYRAFMFSIRYRGHAHSKFLRFIYIPASYPSTYGSRRYCFLLTVYSITLVFLLRPPEIRLVFRLVSIGIISWCALRLHSSSKVVLALSILIGFSLLLRLIVLKKLVSASYLLIIHSLFPLLICFLLYLLVPQWEFLLKLFF